MTTRSVMAPAQPVRRHLQLLALRGVRPAEVARRTGYSRAALSYITHSAQRVHVETSEDIFSIEIPAPPGTDVTTRTPQSDIQTEDR